MKKILIILSIASLFLLKGCVTPYVPTGIEEISGILVVDGTITDGTTIIRLSRSLGIEELPTANMYISDAEVSVEDDNGTVTNASSVTSGEYQIPTGTLNAERKYRLNIHYNGDHYQSSFLTPMITPEIDSVYYRKGNSTPSGVSDLNVYVATHSNDNDYNYFRWTYVEEWEYKAAIFAEIDTVAKNKGDRELIYYELGTPNNRYYCWANIKSDRFILESTGKLTSNTIKDKKLLGESVQDERWSQLYRIQVKQNLIRKEAYDYFSALQNNIENAGSIFAPMPSKVEGNISCVNNSEKIVIGYVEVATTTNNEKYIEPKGIYEPTNPCFGSEVEEGYVQENLLMFSYKIYKINENGIFMWAPKQCVDCTSASYRSKKRPANWPTDNY